MWIRLPHGFFECPCLFIIWNNSQHGSRLLIRYKKIHLNQLIPLYRQKPVLEKIYYSIPSTGFSGQTYLVFITSYFPWLTILVVLPISVGSSIFFLPHKGNKMFRWYAICICSLELLLTTYVFCYHFQLDDPLTQLEEDLKWIDVFDFHWRLGIDGLSIGPILLTGFILEIFIR